MFKRQIVTDAKSLARDLQTKLTEYLENHRAGIGMYTISPVGEITVSDSMWVRDIDYHDAIAGLIKMNYPDEAFEKMKEYNQKYPELTEEELNADPIFKESGGLVHPYYDRIMERHEAEMKIREMATITLRPDNILKCCESAVCFFRGDQDYFDELAFKDIELNDPEIAKEIKMIGKSQ